MIPSTARVVAADSEIRKTTKTARIIKIQCSIVALAAPVLVKDSRAEPESKGKSRKTQRDPRNIIANDATVQFL
jgi:hypothetical protein